MSVCRIVGIGEPCKAQAMRAANDNTIAWGGWALIAVAFAVAAGLFVWSVAGWLDRSGVFRPTRPEEVRAQTLPDGAMTPQMAWAIYMKTGSEAEAEAMTAATRGPLQPADFQTVIRSRRRFVDEARRFGFTPILADNAFWMVTSGYRIEGDGQKLREAMNKVDPP